MTVMTVADLIGALKQLPQDAEVWEATLAHEGPARTLDDLDFHVYAKAGEVRLVFHDGRGFHVNLDPHMINFRSWLEGARPEADA